MLLGITTVSLDAFEWSARPHSLLEAMDTYQGTLAWLPNFAFGHLVRTKRGDETYDSATYGRSSTVPSRASPRRSTGSSRRSATTGYGVTSC